MPSLCFLVTQCVVVEETKAVRKRRTACINITAEPAQSINKEQLNNTHTEVM